MAKLSLNEIRARAVDLLAELAGNPVASRRAERTSIQPDQRKTGDRTFLSYNKLEDNLKVARVSDSL